jgi:hypothetical protein
VLSDDELQALREIGRRLRWESPELVRLFKNHFHTQEPQPTKNRRQKARARALLAAAAIKGLLLRGPRMPTEAEVLTQRRAPLPHTAAFDTSTAVIDPAALPATVEVDARLAAPLPIVTTSRCLAA